MLAKEIQKGIKKVIPILKKVIPIFLKKVIPILHKNNRKR
jgi:hypothetical protein